MPAPRTPSETVAALDDVRRALANLVDFLAKAEMELLKKQTRLKVLTNVVNHQTKHLDGLRKDPDAIISLPEYKRMKMGVIGHRDTIKKLTADVRILEDKVRASKKTQESLKKEEATLHAGLEARGKLLPLRGRHG